MNISRKNAQITFRSKHPDVRLADDIMRKSKRNFPCYSATYAYRNYLCLNENSKYYERANKITDKIGNKLLNRLRDDNKLNTVTGNEILNRLKIYKLGNCYEKAIATIAELAKHGYKSYPIGLGLIVKLIEKSTKEIVNTKTIDLDHIFVFTTMNNRMRLNKNKLIVVDPWLDFTGEINSAIEKYFQYCSKRIDKIKNLFSSEKELTDKYEMKLKLGFSLINISEKSLSEIEKYLT